MTQSTIDWLVVLFFLTALFLVSRFRRSMSAVDAQSYQHIGIGLAVLSVIALARLYSGLGAFDSIPFLAEPLFFKLVSWIGIITGIMFLINGISSWLPLAKKLEANDIASRTSGSLIREIEQLIAVEHRMDHLLTNVLTHIVKAERLRVGAVYTIASTTGETRMVAGDGDPEQLERLRSARYDDTGWLRYLEEGHSAETSGLITDLPIVLGMPSTVLPVAVNNRLRAVFVGWNSEHTELSGDERLQLKLIADILSRRMGDELTQLKNRFLTQCADLRDNVRRAMDTSGARPESLPVIVRELATVLPIDYFSLVLLHPTRPICDRYSVGPDNQLLAFRSMPWPGTNDMLAQILISDEAVSVRAGDPALDELPAGFLPDILNTITLMPIRIEGQPGGLLIVGSESMMAVGRRTSALLDAVVPTLAQLVYSHARRVGDVSWEARLVRLAALADHDDRAYRRELWLNRVARFLHEELHVESIRIATVDPAGSFLNSRALYAVSQTPHVAPADESMVLSLLPAHQEALAAGTTIYLTRGELLARTSEAERSMIHRADICQLMIVPVFDNGEAIGTITLADTRSPDDISLGAGAKALLSATGWMLAGLTTTTSYLPSRVRPSEPPATSVAARRDLRRMILGEALITESPETTDSETNDRPAPSFDSGAAVNRMEAVDLEEVK
ncbi:hypothetical protein KQH51_01745 [bacterium]|nr:hypothetical protein [bacterium]MCB2201648.1 hypothetical protein [bacterium]